MGKLCVAGNDGYVQHVHLFLEVTDGLDYLLYTAFASFDDMILIDCSD